ncbi:hypothetical protein DXG03_004696 [Asterophora parasitica]|uniref:NAD(P)-binding domain-containing protein n=1 Tax=Asterophora parasitica TaxID=117018 RepID=A0A9P7FT91_9AGAR|nr:hypothetical protein DXG03_004696 [Asterophora parasitica]
MNILVIGGSRNVGYFASLRFLGASSSYHRMEGSLLIAAVEVGHTVTFLLRNTSVFDNDADVQQYLRSNQAYLVVPLPSLLKPVYGYLIAVPHRDKVGVERVMAHVAGWKWNDKEDGELVENVLDAQGRWRNGLPTEGTLKEVLVIRPAIFTDGDCLAESGKKMCRVSEKELGGWTVSRKDVAHFVADAALNRWGEFKGKRVNIAY